MPTYIVPVGSDLVEELEESFFHGPIVTDDGLRLLNEEEIGRMNKMSVQIQSDEHPPPHFHVRYGGENASFGLADGKRLPGTKGLERYDRNVKQWWKEHKCELIHAWNRLRPADCTVGPVPVPPDCEADQSG